MKKATIILALTLAASAATAAQLVEAIVVRVGDRIMTRTQYLKRLSESYNEVEQTTPPDQVAARKAEVRKNLLNDVIAELLIKDRADRMGLSVTDSDMKDAIVRLKQQYGIQTDEAFEESLKKSGMTRAEMENRLRDTLIANKVFGRELRSREDLTDRELRERYDREKEHYRLPERARLRAIIIAKPDNAAQAAQAQARAD
ncbi:MAG TPA: SurA N-terminal domain-containing protein, partial [Thermoanaerobaculia bacterium]|nr:SurA N-terminal domain-containing protein [Thermoanaerobaculia bacterium]